MDNTIKSRPPPIGLFLFTDRRRGSKPSAPWGQVILSSIKGTHYGLVDSACGLLSIPLLNNKTC